MKKAVVLFSGGKDSCLALHKAILSGYEVEFLLSILPEGEDAWMFHTPDLELLERQAHEAGFALRTLKTKIGEKNELENLRKIISEVKGKAEVLVIGGIASSYQATRIKKIAEEAGLEVYAPLWNYSADELWNELFEEGFKVIMTKIACEGLPREFLGKVIDKKIFEELKKLSEKYKFRLDFEGGEAETAVLFMPEFKREIKVDFEVKSEGEYRHFLKVKKVF